MASSSKVTATAPTAVAQPTAAAAGHRDDNDPYLLMPQLMENLNAARVARGATPLRIDRGLALVAEQAQAQYQRLGRGLEQRVATAANQELQALALTFQSVLTLVVCAETLQQAQAALNPALEPSMQFAGLSVAPVPGRPKSHGFSVVLTLGQ